MATETPTPHSTQQVALASLKGTEECLLFPTGAVWEVWCGQKARWNFSTWHILYRHQSKAIPHTQSPTLTLSIPGRHGVAVGFAANMAVVSALCDGGNVDIFSDELNHASIVDGARLALRVGGSNRLYVYRHNDLAHLEQLLVRSHSRESTTSSASSAPSASSQGHSNGPPMRGGAHGVGGPQGRVPSAKRRRLVVTDSLFSMDGDFADLKVGGPDVDIMEVCR